MSSQPRYPDITAILAEKMRGRRERAALSFAEKLMILEKLRADVAPIVRARRERTRTLGEDANPDLRTAP